MVIHAVGELPVVVEDEPSPLPPLGPIDRVGEVPVGRHEQVAALGDLPARLVELDGAGRVVLFQTEAVGTFALVENIWSEFSALHIGHGGCVMFCGSWSVFRSWPAAE